VNHKGTEGTEGSKVSDGSISLEEVMWNLAVVAGGDRWLMGGMSLSGNLLDSQLRFEKSREEEGKEAIAFVFVPTACSFWAVF